jgi:uridine kinase
MADTKHGLDSYERSRLLQDLSQRIVSINCDHPLRVAIDGIDGAGKTWLADELVKPIENLGKQVVRASIDGFHRPKGDRYKKGSDSPEGYYHDSFNYEGLKEALLIPLGQNGSRRYRSAIFDVKTDSARREPMRGASKDAILLFDGVFLFRPGLESFWDYKIFLEVDFLVAIPRACMRASEFLKSPLPVVTRLCKRYMAGNRIYLENVKPQKFANVIIDNNDIAHPRFLKV